MVNSSQKCIQTNLDKKRWRSNGRHPIYRERISFSDRPVESAALNKRSSKGSLRFSGISSQSAISIRTYDSFSRKGVSSLISCKLPANLGNSRKICNTLSFLCVVCGSSMSHNASLTGVLSTLLKSGSPAKARNMVLPIE